MNFFINLNCFYSISPVLYQSINIIVNKFKTMIFFFIFEIKILCFTTELKQIVVSSKLISFSKIQKGNQKPQIETEQKIQWPKKNNKRTNNDPQRIKLKIEQHEPRQKHAVHSCAPEGLAVPAPHVTPVVVLLDDTNMI